MPMQAWYAFFTIIILAISFDLYISSKKKHDQKSYRLSIYMTCLWVMLALIFALFIWFFATGHDAILFITGYLIELSLSVDNIFVFILIFSQFNLSDSAQHKILMIGIVSAIIMRLIMITAGVYLIQNFQWLFYVFGTVLIYSGVHILINRNKDNNKKDRSQFMEKISQYLPIIENNAGNKFFIKQNGKYYITNMIIVLVLIEKADLIFALDSIPAILAITDNTFIVFTSNIFAILGLRSMYFFLSHALKQFAYIKYALSFILCYIGCKMIASMQGLHIPISISLSIILLSISAAVAISLYKKS